MADFSSFAFDPLTETETGQYYTLRPNISRRADPSSRQQDSFIAKVYFAPIDSVQEIADKWSFINTHVTDSVELVATLVRDGRRALVFKNRPQRMCDVMDAAEGMDLDGQTLMCTLVARTVLELHRSARCIHTRLHPKRFYRDSDGKFKLGHFSKVEAISMHTDTEAISLIFEERIRLGKLMVYLLTNLPFDKLVRYSPIEVVDELLRFPFPDSISENTRHIKRAVITLLVPRDGQGSDSDIEEMLRLCDRFMPVSTPPVASQWQDVNVRYPSGVVYCSRCGLVSDLKPTAQCVRLPCSHNYCFRCVYNGMLEVTPTDGVFTCGVCNNSIKVTEVAKRFSNPKLQSILAQGLAASR